MLACSAAFGIFGLWFAAQTLNEIFHESPAFFPVAQATAAYFGAVLGTIAAGILMITLLVTFFGSLIIMWGIAFGKGWSGTLGPAVVIVVLMFLGGFMKGILVPAEDWARQLILRVALAGDFFPAHQCDTRDWPQDVRRVAFIGDEQMLGYLGPGQPFLVLGCERMPVTGAAATPPR